MLEMELEYYRLNEEMLMEKYFGKYLVIKGQKVLGVYNSHFEAYIMTAPVEPIDSYLIKLCKAKMPESSHLE